MGALLTPPTTLTGEDYATVMVSLEFHQLIRRVCWSALDTYLESGGVVCSELLEWPVLISGRPYGFSCGKTAIFHKSYMFELTRSTIILAI